MRCEPANTIIEKLGGLRKVAEASGVRVHTVMRWRSPRDRGGTGGVIPHWHIERLLAFAASVSIDLSVHDFAFLPRPDASNSPADDSSSPSATSPAGASSPVGAFSSELPEAAE